MNTSDQESQLHLNLLESLCAELSHELRSPLGVALSVIRDAAAGLSVHSEDFKDAEESLRDILGICNLLQEASTDKKIPLTKSTFLSAWKQLAKEEFLPSTTREDIRYSIRWQSNVSQEDSGTGSESADKGFVSALRKAFGYLLDHSSKSIGLKAVADTGTSISAALYIFTDEDKRTHYRFCFGETLTPNQASRDLQAVALHRHCRRGSRVLALLPLLGMLRNQESEMLLALDDPEVLALEIII